MRAREDAEHHLQQQLGSLDRLFGFQNREMRANARALSAQALEPSPLPLARVIPPASRAHIYNVQHTPIIHMRLIALSRV